MQKSIDNVTPKKATFKKKITLTEDIDPSTNYKKKRYFFTSSWHKKIPKPQKEKRESSDQPS